MAQRGQEKMAFTTDASVVVRWLIPGEEHENQAVRLRNDYAEGKIELNAPTLLRYETLNSLWKAVERNNVRVEDALSIWKTFLKIEPKSINLDPEDLTKALKIATTNHTTSYDASYIATAIKTESTLMTADQGLYDIAKKYVKTIHLKDY